LPDGDAELQQQRLRSLRARAPDHAQTLRVVNVATGKVDKSWRIPACPAT
jgi:hypothetical protein